VVDIACLQHNSEQAAAVIVSEIHRVLKPGGRQFSLASRAGCWGDGTGVRVDATSFRDVTEGRFPPWVWCGLPRRKACSAFIRVP
jgi:hypothetical protein